MSKIISDVEIYVTSLLKNKLQKTLKFHNYQHTKYVAQAVFQIGNNSGLTDEELELVMIAAWFHDTGHTVNYSGHEDESKIIAKDYLTRIKYDKVSIRKVVDCIQATKLPQKPMDLLEEIMCDADLFHLSQKDFFIKNEWLRNEWELVLNKFYSDSEWYKLNVRFLKNHRYFSPFGKLILEGKKKVNIKKLKQYYFSYNKKQLVIS